KWASRLKSSISRLVHPPGPPPKLIFDPLEQRLLMSADPVVVDLSAIQPAQQNHDVLVRFLDQVVTTNEQTQHIQRIETVDRNN
ncbi:LEPR-XLL domain-containing protein, partial [Chromohalobacter sp. HP20-39]|uniref:LEPR-XLL domain-containing protein n=1 Tax=Chromohalobacter sp. HP20-39 TaxID=3079306 RepID=UPI00294AF44B